MRVIEARWGHTAAICAIRYRTRVIEARWGHTAAICATQDRTRVIQDRMRVIEEMSWGQTEASTRVIEEMSWGQTEASTKVIQDCTKVSVAWRGRICLKAERFALL